MMHISPSEIFQYEITSLNFCHVVQFNSFIQVHCHIVYIQSITTLTPFLFHVF